jgi:hypothetical protein
MAVELLEFLPQHLTADVGLKIVKRFGNRQFAVATPVVVAGKGVVSTSLDVESRQILSHQMGRTEEALRQIGIE